jgi:ArsR family transcriptional regulator
VDRQKLPLCARTAHRTLGRRVERSNSLQFPLRQFDHSNMLSFLSRKEPPVPESLWPYKAEVFQALAHATRVGMIEILREGESSVRGLCERLGIEQANASQHLAVLRSKRLVVARREANQVIYRLRDPLIGEVLDPLRQLCQSRVDELSDCLREDAA